MYYFNELMHNKMLISACLGWGIAQIIKTIIDFYFNRKINFERLVGSGGMPSCHSSTVCSLAVTAALEYGFDSSAFAIATILAIIVMYDARGVRRETGTQAVVLNQMMEFFRAPNNGELFKMEFDQEKLKELVGHTPLQVACGAVLGIIIGTTAFYMLP